MSLGHDKHHVQQITQMTTPDIEILQVNQKMVSKLMSNWLMRKPICEHPFTHPHLCAVVTSVNKKEKRKTTNDETSIHKIIKWERATWLMLFCVSVALSVVNGKCCCYGL